MRRPPLWVALVPLAALSGPLVWSCAAPSARPSHELPGVMLWAWERAEDLRSLDAGVGVAFLAQTITIDRERIRLEPRRWPLRVAEGAVLSAVTRLEWPGTRETSAEDEERIASAIAATATLPRVAGVQVDFDASASQRGFYRRLIERVRSRLDPRLPLSMTALASWCGGDPWLDGLPVDEAVPMLFRLGPLNTPYRDIAASASAAHRSCRTSIGMSLDEPLRLEPRGRRVYVFNPRAWAPDTWHRAVQAARGARGTQ